MATRPKAKAKAKVAVKKGTPGRPRGKVTPATSVKEPSQKRKNSAATLRGVQEAWTVEEPPEKIAAFADEYLKCFSPMKAAIAVGYSDHSAYSTGHRLLKDPRVQAILAPRKEAIAKANEVTTDRIILELKRIAFSDSRALYNEYGRPKLPHELDDDEAAAVSSFDPGQFGTKIRKVDKTRAMDLLIKLVGPANVLPEGQEPSAGIVVNYTGGVPD